MIGWARRWTVYSLVVLGVAAAAVLLRLYGPPRDFEMCE